MNKINYPYHVIKKGDSDFPPRLYHLKKVPEQLYVMGNNDVLKGFSIGVVGARNVSDIGKNVAKKISQGLCESDVTLVSGFAYGVDTIAHETAILNRKKTIAVLAGGFEHIYPRENMRLIDQLITNGGAIICENDIDTPPLPSLFTSRNRIIAALSKGVVIIEAKETSGSLITANYAIQLKREVFVVPGGVEDDH